MRRKLRKNDNNKSVSDKIIMYSGIGVTILAVIVIGLLIYSKSLNDDVREGTMTLEQMSKITGNTAQNTTQNSTENSTSVSTEIGKTVEESKNEANQNTTNQVNTSNSNKSGTNVKNNTSNVANTTNTKNIADTTQTNSNATENVEENKKELEFQKPVEGEIVREYAKDNLIYSTTLEEWTTHMGIDIKADKTTVVKSAEAGTVKSIKNDPRYGLTIVVEHENGFQTVYANLLTSEFVVEGEKVEKGQSLGTVGNTAIFESADEAHLHFEILKDSIQVDPSIYIK